jgi:photosystem II stability/assembly factor-like uncharacterized protein
MKQSSRLFYRSGIVAALFGLVACEAPLNLEGVEQEQKKAYHRYDQLQAAASNDQYTVIVGSAGTVLVSSDEGKSWQRSELSGKPSLIDITSCNDHFIALAMDRGLWVSDTSAGSWQVKPIETMEEVLSVECSGDQHYWVTGSFSTIIESQDGGDSWVENSLGEDAQLTTIQFLNEELGFASGEFGVVLKTEDAGASWNPVEYLPNEFYPQAAHFRDENTGWVVGLSGSILHTNDGGQSWQAQDSGTDVPLYGIDGNGSTLISVGDNGLILSYDNDQWKALEGSGQVLAYLRAVTVRDEKVIAAGGNGSVIALPE